MIVNFLSADRYTVSHFVEGIAYTIVMNLRADLLGQRKRQCGPRQASSPRLSRRQRSARDLGLHTLSRHQDLGGHDATNSDDSLLLQKPFLLLARQLNFERIEEILTLLNARALAPWLENFGSANDDAGLQAFKGVTMLHLIMKYRPPVTVVGLLIQRLSELRDGLVPENAADLRGMTPLHLAVQYCCDSSVIKRLVNGVASGVPAGTKDTSGRLPLHYACNDPKGLKGQGGFFLACGSRSKISDNMMEITKILMATYPHAVMVKDINGSTPLNLAMENGASHDTVLLLDRARQKLTAENTSASTRTGTETESEAYFPVDFAIAGSFLPCDSGDDLSSIGSGGVSRYKGNGRRSPRTKSSRLSMPYVHEQIQI